MKLKAILPWIGLITGATFLFLWPVIYAEFTELDDKHLILTWYERYANRPWRIWNANIFSPHYKPLVMLSWHFEGKIFGLNPVVLHFNNLLLHAVNSVFAFFIIRKLAVCFDSIRMHAHWVALFAALLFAVHPLHVESVAWAVERKDVLYTCFFFLGILAYFRYLEKASMRWMILTAVAFTAALCSKAPAIIFPFILLLVDWAYDKPMKLIRLTEKWPIILVFFAGLWIYGVFGAGGNGAVGDEGSFANMISEKPISRVYPLTELPVFYGKIVLIGLKGVFWYLHSYIPAGLSLAYPYRGWLPAIGHGIHILPAVLALGTFLIWRKRKEKRFLYFTHAFFFIALAPALIRTGLGRGIFLSDRYVYLALLGFTFFISGTVIALMNKRKWPERRQWIVMSAVVLVMGVLSFLQARIWRTGETLWSNVIDLYPGIDYAYVNRAIWYKENNMPERALEDLNRAISLEQFDEHAFIHRGTLLRQTGNREQALADFDMALQRAPRSEYAIGGKANVLFEMGRYAEAEAMYSQGLEYSPYMVTLLVNRAAARYFLRKYDEALDDLANAERITPAYASIFQKRTAILMAKQDYANAVISAQKTAQYEPENHANFGDLGTALQNLGRHQEAIEAFTQALRIYNRGDRYYLGRARSYEALGNISAAEQDRQTAASL